MSAIAIAANRKASGTARPISPAGATPLSAIAAVGAMIPIDSAIASQKRSSRRRVPFGRSSATVASVAISASFLEDRIRHERADDPVRGVDDLVDAQVARDAGECVRLLTVEAVTVAEVCDRRPHGVAGRLHQVGTDAGADVVARLLVRPDEAARDVVLRRLDPHV